MYSFLIDIPDNRFIVIPDFPSKDGWYLPHDATGIPHGKRLDSPIDNPEARYLLRGKCCHIALLNFFLSIESDNPFIDIWHTKKIIKNRIGVNARGMVTDPFSVGVVFPEEELERRGPGRRSLLYIGDGCLIGKTRRRAFIRRFSPRRGRTFAGENQRH